ncbi:MAG: cell wall hydrolase [Novosphingobium sp.]
MAVGAIPMAQAAAAPAPTTVEEAFQDFSAQELLEGTPVEPDSPALDPQPHSRFAPVYRPLPQEPDGKSFQSFVAHQRLPREVSGEIGCLAGAIYFESRGEPLEGQLAVGRVVVARARSGKFPASYCAVVFQPRQFSFVRDGSMPPIDFYSWQWRNAVAVAQIAHAGTWRSPVEGALFYHATYVSPGWRRNVMAQVGNHIFYR